MFGSYCCILTSKNTMTHVMSSTISSSSCFHFKYDSRTTASAAFSAFLHSKYGRTIFAISSLLRNSQTPSLARTINLSSGHKSSSSISRINKSQLVRMINELTWFCSHSNSWSNFISKWSCHGQSWNIIILKPHSEWTNWIFIWVSKWIYSSTIFYDPSSFIRLTWFLVSWNGLSNQLSTNISLLFLDNNTSWVSDISTK